MQLAHQEEEFGLFSGGLPRRSRACATEKACAARWTPCSLAEVQAQGRRSRRVRQAEKRRQRRRSAAAYVHVAVFAGAVLQYLNQQIRKRTNEEKKKEKKNVFFSKKGKWKTKKKHGRVADNLPTCRQLCRHLPSLPVDTLSGLLRPPEEP